jgi:hypothetical protein
LSSKELRLSRPRKIGIIVGRIAVVKVGVRMAKDVNASLTGDNLPIIVDTGIDKPTIVAGFAQTCQDIWQP